MRLTVRAKDIYAGRNHEPTSGEIVTWREFSNLAIALALGQRRSWRELQDMARQCGGLRVFGHNTRGNVCNMLVDLSIEAATSVDHVRYADELTRLGYEVLKRCDQVDELRKAARHG